MCFAEDKNDFYYCGLPLGVVDKQNFRQIYVNGNLWGVDSKFCYYQDKKCVINDFKCFKVLKYGNYAKDNENVYYSGEIVEGADAQTFCATTIFCGKDKNNMFDMGEIVVK